MKIPLFRIVEIEAENKTNVLYFPTKTTAERYQQDNKKNKDLKIGQWEKIRIESKRLLCMMLSSSSERSKLNKFFEHCERKGYLIQK